MKMVDKTLLAGIALVFSIVLGASGPSYAVDLSEVKEAIRNHGAQWVAGKTKISELPAQLMKNRLGLILSTQDKEPAEPSVSAGELPSSFDWRDQNAVTPVKDQGNCGSCWAFASIAALESLAIIETGASVPDYSEQFPISYNLSNLGCEGGELTNAANFYKRIGTVPDTCLPYRGDDRKLPFPCSEWRDDVAGIEKWSLVRQTVDALKAAVYENPIAVGYNIYSDFLYYESGVYEYVSGKLVGGHAVLIVGWDDAEECFIVKNSWGENWGENGYFRIAYSQVTNQVRFGMQAIDFDGAWVLPWEVDQN